MNSIWINSRKLESSLTRNEAFWRGELEDCPLMWITAPVAAPDKGSAEPEDEQKLWTDIELRLDRAEHTLANTHYAGDSLPVFNPWFGPDQVAAWLGAEITLKPKEFTSWVKPFVDDWAKYPELRISEHNRWWRLYLDLVRASAEAGRDKWVTAFPDLHTGIDGLSAIRGPENLMMDMLSEPETIYSAMSQMTELWKYVVDEVSEIILPTGQGCSNWTMGWSEKRFLCIGQNDFSCMISPDMFTEFCRDDNVQCCDYVDYSLYHLDGPDALRHLPAILALEKLNTVQWIQGAGHPPPSKWTDTLKHIQSNGKSVQLYYGAGHGAEADLFKEVEVLCGELDPTKLFIWAEVASAGKAEAIVKYAQEVCRRKRASSPRSICGCK